MPRRSARTLLAAVAASSGLLAMLTVDATAAPTCTIAGTEAVCGGRVVAEPATSTSFIQFGLEFPDVVAAVEAINPDVMEAYTLAELTGDPSHVSSGGRDIYVLRITDESVPQDDKLQVVASLSIHANESAGREGGIRYAEDLARWSLDDPDRLLYSGDVEVPLSQVLAEVELWLGFPNPDGWAAGDVGGSGGTFDRYNAEGFDLNRQFPTMGWTNREYEQMSQPEAQGWVAFVSALPNLTVATDIHGELTTVSDGAFADMMWPAGEWSPREQEQELQLAEHMVATIERKFDEYGVSLETITSTLAPALSGSGVATQPAQYATAYDVVGYDDSGFMGDWFVTQGAVEIDIENFLSHLAPGNIWVSQLEEAHVAAVRGILETVAVEALVTGDVTPQLDLGRVAYVRDPATVSSTDEDDVLFFPEDGEVVEDYDVTRMQYFEDLAADTSQPVDALAAADVATTDLSVYDSIVLADVAVPADPQGRPVAEGAYARALQAFVEEGGQLVLTDGAVSLLATMGLVSEDDLLFAKSQAGHVDFGERDHPWEADLRGLPQQTFYAVPLGYRSSSSIQEAPHHGVARAVWEGLDGTTIGTMDDDDQMVTLGEAPLGQGRIAIFGAILPTQTEENPHLHGLANYAMSVNGGKVLHEILSFRREGAPAPDDTTAPAVPGETPPTPVTGGGLALVGLLGVAGAAALRRR